MQPKGYRAMKRANLNKRYGNGITKTKKLTLLSASRFEVSMI